MKLFHIHKWIPVSVNAGPGTAESLFGGHIEVGVTVILYRCECTKTKTETIEGYWTLEQLKGES